MLLVVFSCRSWVYESIATVIAPENIKGIARQRNEATRKLITRLASSDKRRLDNIVHGFHHEIFSKYNCMQCANCCRSLGPRITQRDIEVLAKTLKQKQQSFVETYLRIDSDGDYVFKQMPCPFLDGDNSCRVYQHRPKACREYPHTDRPRFYQLLALSAKNAEVCPVVYEILLRLEKMKI